MKLAPVCHTVYKRGTNKERDFLPGYSIMVCAFYGRHGSVKCLASELGIQCKRNLMCNHR